MERISQAARAMLTGRILPFWEGLLDETSGGYYGYMSADHELDKKAEKGCILNSRILWVFSSAGVTLNDSSLVPYARQAYDFLRTAFWDKQYGGVFWSVTWDGKPLDDSKHTYCQAFAIYGLAAYYRLSGEEALRLAEALFDLIEAKCTDAGGYLEAFTRDFSPASNEKLSENGVMAARTMNTLLHVFEGYAGLYQVKKLPRVANALGRILDLYAEKAFDPVRRRQTVFFDHDYHSLIDLTSYGHDIESSWLMDWGTGLLEDAALSRRIGDINSRLAGQVLRDGFQNGSLANECERGVVDQSRVWWVQAEAVLGFVNEFLKHPERTDCRDAAAEIWHFIAEKVVDNRPGGEWFWQVDVNGSPDKSRAMVDPWKCPYHNGRMCLELIRRDPDVCV